MIKPLDDESTLFAIESKINKTIIPVKQRLLTRLEDSNLVAASRDKILSSDNILRAEIKIEDKIVSSVLSIKLTFFCLLFS